MIILPGFFPTFQGLYKSTSFRAPGAMEKTLRQWLDRAWLCWGLGPYIAVTGRRSGAVWRLWWSEKPIKRSGIYYIHHICVYIYIVLYDIVLFWGSESHSEHTINHIHILTTFIISGFSNSLEVLTICPTHIVGKQLPSIVGDSRVWGMVILN